MPAVALSAGGGVACCVGGVSSGACGWEGTVRPSSVPGGACGPSGTEPFTPTAGGSGGSSTCGGGCWPLAGGVAVAFLAGSSGRKPSSGAGWLAMTPSVLLTSGAPRTAGGRSAAIVELSTPAGGPSGVAGAKELLKGPTSPGGSTAVAFCDTTSAGSAAVVPLVVRSAVVLPLVAGSAAASGGSRSVALGARRASSEALAEGLEAEVPFSASSVSLPATKPDAVSLSDAGASVWLALVPDVKFVAIRVSFRSSGALVLARGDVAFSSGAVTFVAPAVVLFRRGLTSFFVKFSRASPVALQTISQPIMRVRAGLGAGAACCWRRRRASRRAAASPVTLDAPGVVSNKLPFGAATAAAGGGGGGNAALGAAARSAPGSHLRKQPVGSGAVSPIARHADSDRTYSRPSSKTELPPSPPSPSQLPPPQSDQSAHVQPWARRASGGGAPWSRSTRCSSASVDGASV